MCVGLVTRSVNPDGAVFRMKQRRRCSVATALVLWLLTIGCGGADGTSGLGVPEMLEHVSPRVRVKGLERVEARRRDDLLDRVIPMLGDPDPVVRSRAAATIRRLRPGWPLDDYDPWLPRARIVGIVDRLETLESE